MLGRWLEQTEMCSESFWLDCSAKCRENDILSASLFNGPDEDTDKGFLQNGLTDIFKVAAVLKKCL